MYSVWILFTGSPPVRCEWCTAVLPNVSVCTVYGYCSQVHHLLDVSGAQLCFLMSLYVWVYPGGGGHSADAQVGRCGTGV